MFTLKVENNKGEVYNLSASDNYTVYKIAGLTPPMVAISQTDNSLMDGGTINNVRMGSRNIVIYMTINGDVETNRINLYKYFPPKKSVKLYYKNDTRDVYIEGVVELIECDLFAQRQVAQVSIICPYPYFKAVEDLVTYFSEVESMISFPFSITESGIELSSVINEPRKTILNTGDGETGVVIELYAIGNVTNPVIYDVFNRTHLKLNCSMVADDLITINTNTGKKSITRTRGGVTTNAMGYLTQDSVWLQLSNGDNVFTYACDSGAANLQLTFKTQILYGGV